MATNPARQLATFQQGTERRTCRGTREKSFLRFLQASLKNPVKFQHLVIRMVEPCPRAPQLSIVFVRGSGPIDCWGGYAGGFAGPEFVEGVASRGFAARLWLRGVASLGFADICSTNISHVCAPMLLTQVESMRKGATKGNKRGIELQD